MMKRILVLATVLAVCITAVVWTANADGWNTAAGGWNAAADPSITEEIRTIVEKGLNGLVGVKYEPITYLGCQVVAGRNHAVLCKASPVTLNAIPTWKILFFYEDLQGNVKLINIADLDFGTLCTYGSPAE